MDSINADKSEILLKSPNSQLHEALGTEVTFGSLIIPVRSKIIVLGTRINTDMTRRTIIIDRCQRATRVYYALCTHLRPLQLSFRLLVRIYTVMIVPIMLYGLRSISFTESNKRILMRRELNMLQGLAKIAVPSVSQSVTLQQVLRGRTINRRLLSGRLAYYSHIRRRTCHSLIQRSYQYKLKSKRKVGRPCYTFRTFLSKELTAVKHNSLNEWKESFATAEATKKLCEKLYEVEHLSNDPALPQARIYLPPQRAI